MKPRLCIVKWLDAHFINEEASHESVEKCHKPSVYWSAGVLVKSDETGVTLAMDYGLPLEDNNEFSYRTRSFIPRRLVEAEIDAGALMKAEKPRSKSLPQPLSGAHQSHDPHEK